MRWITVLVLCMTPWALQADTLETVYFRGNLSPAQLTPPIEASASGDATITVYLRRDTAGEIVSGVADFAIEYDVQPASAATALHIRRGQAGQNGMAVFDGQLSSTEPVALAGRGRLTGQAMIATAPDRAVVNELLLDPSGFYVDLRTEENPDGLMRGQLMRMQRLSMNAPLELPPLAEVAPPPPPVYLGSGSVEALYVRDAGGAVIDGMVRYDVAYDYYPADVTILGAHVHQGEEEGIGPAHLQSGFPYSDPIADPNGKGSVSYVVQASSPEDIAALQAMVDDPASFYLHLHVTTSPESAARADIHGPLAANSEVVYSFPVLPGNVVPPVALDAWGFGRVTVAVARDTEGEIVSGVVDLAAAYRFPGSVTFLGSHVREGMTGVNARYLSPNKFSFPAAFTDADGSGALHYRVSISPTDAGGVSALATVLDAPADHYLDFHTVEHHTPSALRGQLVGPAVEPMISEGGIVNASLAEGTTTASPGSLISIFGTNLSQATVGPVVKNGKLTTNASGTEVSIGGLSAAILHASAGQLNVQTPVGLHAGEADVKVTTVWGVSAAQSLLISNASPGIFAVVKATDFSVVTPDNPVAPGQTVIVFATGLGAGTPPLNTGQLAPAAPLSPTAMTPIAAIGGIGATVAVSVMAPAMAGVQQVHVVVPGGLAAGPQELTFTVDGVTSNSQTIYLQ